MFAVMSAVAKDVIKPILLKMLILIDFIRRWTKPIQSTVTPEALRVFLVDDDTASGDAGAIDEDCGQTDDDLDINHADQTAADIGLDIARKQRAVWQDNRHPCPCL